jgi:DNA-binding winged helix-turn-helix (wHTH) protein/tetratricopeptide (TPR) repeat protein
MAERESRLRGVRFGNFEVDLRSGELRKAGMKVKLSGQPFQVLTILLERHGDVVTREELQKRLWPDTFVDVDHNLNASITKIREALGDSAESPRFVETLPRRGYRFLVPVNDIVEANAPPAAHEPKEPGIAAANHSEAQVQVKQAKPGRPIQSIRWISGVGIFLLAVAAGAFWLSLHRTPVLTDKDTIVLADFSNTTGDPIFDGTLRQGLSVQLQLSPFLSLVSERRMQEMLQMMGRQADTRLSPGTAREICERTGSAAFVEGSIAPLGNQYVLGLRAENCRNGDVLAEEQAQAASKEDVLKALDNTAIRLRRNLGESLSSVQKYATPLQEATTPSLEALKAFSLGRKTFYEMGSAASLPFFKRAVELDPNFAMAYRALAGVYGRLGQQGRGAENIRKAYALRDKVSERERFIIEASYYGGGTGELEKAITAYELLRQTYPRDDWLYVLPAGIYSDLGNFEKALEEAREAVRLEPNSGNNLQALCFVYIDLNRLDEAEAVVKQAEERKVESEELLAARYELAFLKGDTAQMARVVSAAMGKPGLEEMALARQAATEGWYGRLRNARELMLHLDGSVERNDAKGTAGTFQSNAALIEVQSGYTEQAKADSYAAIKLERARRGAQPNELVLINAALSLALAGDTAGAERLAAELDRYFPLDTLVQRFLLPVLRAAVAVQRKDPKRAIELLQVTRQFEVGEYCDLHLFPAYLRGEAYLMLHDGNAAAAEFQKFLDHRGLVRSISWGVLAQLQIGRAYALSGDKVKAKAAYQDFLTLWKDADPDIPILKQAKVEYAKLQ